MLMNVLSTLMAVLTIVSTTLDLTDAVVELDTDWLAMDAPVKVANNNLYILTDMLLEQ